MSKRQGGFTLLELTAAIAIIGTLSAVALPKYADMMRSARGQDGDGARRGERVDAGVSHEVVLDDVQMNGTAYPTNAGILIAAGLADNYDTHAAGVIAVDPQHPNCSPLYAPDTGTSAINYADGPNC